MEKPKDYYQLLGVPRDASVSTIKRAFRRLTRENRPEAQGGVPDVLEELKAAYDTLTDADRRHRYDQLLQRLERPAPIGWSSLRRPPAGDLRRPFQPSSLTGEIVLGREEAAAGGVLSLDVPVTASCGACEGTGGPFFDCDRCFGEGKVHRRLPVPVQIPAGVRDGAVFQVRTDDPAVPSLVLTVHLRQH
jgi:DnaJ-class molecular chaperone